MANKKASETQVEEVNPLQERLAAAEAALEAARANNQQQSDQISELTRATGKLESMIEARVQEPEPEPAKFNPAEGLPDEMADWTKEDREAYETRMRDHFLSESDARSRAIQEEAENRCGAQNARQQNASSFRDKHGMNEDQFQEFYKYLNGMSQLELADVAYGRDFQEHGKESPGLNVSAGAQNIPLPQGVANGPGSPATTASELDQKRESFRQKVLYRNNNDFLAAIKGR